MTSPPEAQRPFVYVCCAREDRDLAQAHVSELPEADYDFHFSDDGLAPHEVDAADAVLFFVSRGTINSQRCQSDIHRALDLQKRIVPILLEPGELPAGLKMSLGVRQALEPARYAFPVYLEKLVEALTGKETSLPVARPTHKARSPASASALEECSLVVMPIRAIGGADAQELADALRDELMTLLRKVPGIRVVARSVGVDTHAPLDLSVVLQPGVTYAISSTLRKVGDRVRVNLRLLDASTGRQLAVDRLQTESDDFFDLSDTLAADMAGSLRPALIAADAARAARTAPAQRTPWLLVQRALHDMYFSGVSPLHANAAIALVDSVLLAEPDYPYALAVSALLRATRAGLLFEEGAPDDVDIAVSHARLALELLPQDAVVLWGWAMASTYGRSDAHSALETLNRAIAEDPHNAAMMADSALLLCQAGRSGEAIAAAEKALRMSRQDPRLYFWQFCLALSWQSEPDRCLEAISQSLALFEMEAAFLVKTFALVAMHREEEAMRTLVRMRELYPSADGRRIRKFIDRFLTAPSDDLARYLEIVRQTGPG